MSFFAPLDFAVDGRRVTLGQLVQEATNEDLIEAEDLGKYITINDLINNCPPQNIDRAYAFLPSFPLCFIFSKASRM